MKFFYNYLNKIFILNIFRKSVRVLNDIVIKFLVLKNIGDWGLGIGDWGLGIGPIPNPQSPINNK